VIALRRALLAVIGVLFVLYPVLRPWHDETTAAGAAAAMGSPLWAVSHGFAMLGFILLPAVPIVFALHERRGHRSLVISAVLLWVGVGLVLPYYGAEAFALQALATSGVSDLVAVSDAIRLGPVQSLAFLLGLLLIAVGAVFTAIGVAKARPWWLGVAFAAGFALFAPQFFGPPAVRIAHGVLIAVGCAILALNARKSEREPEPQPERRTVAG
jgi:hypothetical protein